ncbi:MAG: hypothetical protein LUH40_01305 [Clostridiales bacterium]|nr:hypothetical protein [Clostridiales bacterium]
MKKILSVMLSLILFAWLVLPAFAENGDGITIVNPYENVDWENYNRYKADLHSHTNATDGENTLKEMVEKHYELGYDILAISDHGTTSYSWTEEDVVPTMKTLAMFRKGYLPLEALSESGTAANGNSYTVTQINGDDYYAQDGGQSMLRVPYAIENNPTSFNNAHVNSFFVDYGNGILGGTSDYITPISNVDALGGISVINHPGEYSNARDEVYTADAYDRSNLYYNYVIEKFEDLLMSYDSCIGIDINSKGDNRTRFDRKLWDILLTDLAPYGRNVFAVATSDAHNLNIVNSGYITALMPENTSEALQNCLANGEFLAGSRYIGNLDELIIYASMLEGTSLGAEIQAAADAIESEIETNGKQSTRFTFDEDAEAAYISEIYVDDSENTITISGEGILCVRWVSQGETVGQGASIDIDDCGAESYIRAEIIGEGGITYTQAFLIDDGSTESYSSSFHDFSWLAGILDPIVEFLSVFDNLFGSILKLIGILH